MGTTETCEGAVLLTAKLTPAMSQRDLADALGVTPQAVSAWVSGRARPGSVHREAIERITGIPAESWLTTKERREIGHAATRAKAS